MESPLFPPHVSGDGSSTQINESSLQGQAALPVCIPQHHGIIWGGRDLWRPLVQHLLKAGLIPQLDQVAQGFVQAGFRNRHGQRSHSLPGRLLQCCTTLTQEEFFFFLAGHSLWAATCTHRFLSFCSAPLRKDCLWRLHNCPLVGYLTVYC